MIKPKKIKANGDLSKFVHQVSWQRGHEQMAKIIEPDPESNMGILEKDRFYHKYAKDYINL